MSERLKFPGPASYYQAFGLNETQIETIRSAVPKRHYYVVSPEGFGFVDLQLGPVALAFVAAGSKEEIARVNELSPEFGDEWPARWLKEQGIAV